MVSGRPTTATSANRSYAAASTINLGPEAVHRREDGVDAPVPAVVDGRAESLEHRLAVGMDDVLEVAVREGREDRHLLGPGVDGPAHRAGGSLDGGVELPCEPGDRRPVALGDDREPVLDRRVAETVEHLPAASFCSTA